MDSKARIARALENATDTKAFEMGRGVYASAVNVYNNFFERE